MFKVRPTSLPFLATTFTLAALCVSASSCSVLIDTKTTQCNVDDDCKSLGSGGAGSATCSAAKVCVFDQSSAGTAGTAGTGGAGEMCTKDEDCADLNNDFGDATCSEDGECVAATEPELLEPKGCVEPERSTAETVTLTFDVSLTAPPTKVEDRKPFTIHTCQTTDPNCADPGPDFTVPYGEKAEITVKPGFRGYLEITNPDGLNAVEFLGRPINVDTVGYGVIVPTPSTVALLILATGEKYNEEQGIFVVTTRDCDRQPLRGVSVANTLGGTPFIFQNMSPQKGLTETTAEGAAGFVNVPPGLLSVSAILNRTQKMSGTSAYSRGRSSIPSNPKAWVTYVEIFP